METDTTDSVRDVTAISVWQMLKDCKKVLMIATDAEIMKNVELCGKWCQMRRATCMG